MRVMKAVRQIIAAYNIFRQAGHTRMAVMAWLTTPDAILVVGSMAHADTIINNVAGLETREALRKRVTSVHQIADGAAAWIGRSNVPIIFDNYALLTLFGKILQEKEASAAVIGDMCDRIRATLTVIERSAKELGE
jgi:hypothetical protein